MIEMYYAHVDVHFSENFDFGTNVDKLFLRMES